MLSISADSVLVPLASEADAETTCKALAESFDADARIVLLHVVEKSGGGIDKASVEQREERADEIFATAREHLPADWTVETDIDYATDVGEGIVTTAEELGVDAIAFSPRDAGLLTRILTGTTALDLVTDSPVPVVVLPDLERS